MARRRFGLLKAAAGLGHGLLLVPGWLRQARHTPGSRALERHFMARLARRFVARVEMSGAAPAGPGTLYVSNHISWLDIAVLGGRLDASFIAKAEVSDWPVIGALARRSSTLFVEREQRHRVHDQADAIAVRLQAGHSMILFAEGTTSDGVTILPFRSSLFAAARAARAIQPLAIGYHHGDGARLSDEALRRSGWADKEPLTASLRRTTAMHLSAELRLMPAFAPGDLSRKEMADRCRSAVLEGYAALRKG